MEIFEMSCEIVKHSVKIGTSRAIEGLRFVSSIVANQIRKDAALSLPINCFFLDLFCFLSLCEGIIVEAVTINVVRIDFVDIFAISSHEISASG